MAPAGTAPQVCLLYAYQARQHSRQTAAWSVWFNKRVKPVNIAKSPYPAKKVNTTISQPPAKNECETKAGSTVQ